MTWQKALPKALSPELERSLSPQFEEAHPILNTISETLTFEEGGIEIYRNLIISIIYFAIGIASIFKLRKQQANPETAKQISFIDYVPIIAYIFIASVFMHIYLTGKASIFSAFDPGNASLMV